MSPRAMRSALTPWAGLFLGAGAWFLHQQGGSGLNDWDCRIGPMWSLLLGVLCAALAIVGGVVSWTSRRTAGEDGSAMRRFSGIVGAATAAIFLMTISFQTLAVLIVPACVR